MNVCVCQMCLCVRVYLDSRPAVGKGVQKSYKVLGLVNNPDVHNSCRLGQIIPVINSDNSWTSNNHNRGT